MQLGARHSRIHAGRPQTNDNVEALKTILDECWHPAFARYIYPRYSASDASWTPTSASTTTTASTHERLTQGRIPTEIVYRAQKMKTK